MAQQITITSGDIMVEAYILELSTYDQCHYFYLYNALKSIGINAQEVKLENISSISPDEKPLLVIDGIPLAELEDYISLTSGVVRSFVAKGGKVLAIGEGAILATGVHQDIFEEQPSPLLQREIVHTGELAPRITGANLYNISVYAILLSSIVRDYHSTI